MSTSTPRPARPLSPHLSIYRLTPTMAMSIVHRITGAANYFGVLLVAWWLLSAAIGEHAFAIANGFFASWVGRLILFGYTWSLVHHMFGGIRHLVWDTGRGLEKSTSRRFAQASIVASVLFTLIIWIVGYMVRG
jgi:succinate dehydrogenase / fumarate reductase, cytochrome b subunit